VKTKLSTLTAAAAAGVATLGACGSDERDIAVTFAEWAAINPSLSHYEPLHEEWVPTMGIHWGVPGPHLTVGVGHGDVVTLVEIVVPAAAGWEPWFDQPEGEPTEIHGIGEAYTQHVWITEPDTVVEGEEPVAIALTHDALVAANPKLGQYQQLSDYVPGMGYHYGAPGPAVVLVVGREGEINGFELISPAAQGWYPWFDQPDGEPMTIEGLGEVYTQHLYLVDPATLE
jgi:hypothetical protein